MTRRDKLLEAMRRNPAGDWRMSDVETLCRRVGLACEPPAGGGSHWRVAWPDRPDNIVVIPF